MIKMITSFAFIITLSTSLCAETFDRPGMLLPPIIGPSPVIVGGTFTYEYDPGVVVFSPYWNVGSLGAVQSTWVVGTTYYISVRWTAAGTAAMKFYEDGGLTQLASKNVTINTVPTPTATFSTPIQRCGSTIVKRTNAPPAGVAYEWWWQTSATGTVTTYGKADSVVLTTATPLYLRARTTLSPYVWSTAQPAGSITVITTPPTAPTTSTDGHLISNSGGVVTVKVDTVSGATGYAWYYNSSGGSPIAGQTSNSYSPNVPTTKPYYVATLKGACPSATRKLVTANVYAEPVITATNNGNVVMATPVKLLVSNFAYTTYQWLTGTGTVITDSTHSSFFTVTPGSYKIRVTKSGSAAFTSPAFIVRSGVEGQNMNFIVSNSILVKDITSASAIPALPVASINQTIQYFDGIGRPIQTVTTQGSPLKKDLVQTTAYDAIGRENIKYLPFASDQISGWYKSNTVSVSGSYTGSAHNLFYANGASDGVVDDTKPFSETRFEPSPLNRVIKLGAPGSVWQPDATNTYSSTDRTVKQSNEFNVLNEVLIWRYVKPTSDYSFGLVYAGTIASPTVPVYYAANALTKTRTKNEHQNEVITYTNKSGQVVLKRVQLRGTTITDSNYASTYYIYSDLGDLVCVIPPEATRLLTNTASVYHTATYANKSIFLNRWAFRYNFDNKRRMTVRKAPGTGMVKIVYDNRDRVVLTQDSIQTPLKQWLFTKYDTLNRPVVTGIYTHGTVVNGATMKGLISTTKFCESYNGTTTYHGYTNNVFPLSGTVLSVTYYDNYSFITPLINGGNASITTWNYLPGDLVGQDASYFNRVNGQVTGTKVNILGSANYLWAVSYFDEKYRMIQSFAQNHKGGIDRTTNLYDFVKLKQTKTTHVNGAATYATKRRIEYDHAGRVRQTFHTFNSEPEVLLSDNVYNELGQLTLKKNHSRASSPFVQTTDFQYNIRGWMTKINDTAAPEIGDLFSMELRYNTAGANGSPAQYNGNVSEIVWKSAGQDVQSYEYYYDTLNRLKEARYFNKVRTSFNGRYNEIIGGVNVKGYDFNGNITRLSRYGKKDATTYGLMDNLTYTYTGNLVTRIDDVIASNTLEEGFNEGTIEQANEYTYTAVGNLAKDDNKGITAITYNHLNLPIQVNKGATNYIVYTYDATGRKLKQQVYGTAPKTTDYLGEYLYENDTLKFISHEEGRIVPDNSVGAPRPWEYQYMLKDHLGNVRVMFSEKKMSNEYKATLETATQTSEQSTFKGYGNRSSFSPYNHTTPTGTYSQLLNAGNNSQVGLAKSFAVNPGDVADIEVYAKYEAPTSTNTNVTTLLNALVSTFALGTGTGAESPQAQTAFGGVFSGGGPFISSGMWDSGAPRAYLNYILFDQNFNLIDFGFDQVSTAASSVHELLALHVKVQQKGFLYIYLSNEQAVQTNVYFDDFKINYQSGVEQVVEYYAFGLQQNSNSFQKQSSPKNLFRYNGKELQDELNIGWYDYQARQYDPMIGRFLAVDPAGDKMRRFSVYAYGFDNPVRFTDPDGMTPADFVQKDPGDPIEKLNKIAKAIDSKSNEAWKSSFVMKGEKIKKVNEKGFTIVSNEAGEVKTRNEVEGNAGGIKFNHSVGSGEKLEGDNHTHPYKDGTEGTAFSPEDISSLDKPLKAGATEGFARLVEAGDKRFALVVNDVEKATNFLKKAPIRDRFIDAMSNAEGTHQEKVIFATKHVLGDGTESGINFYQTTNKEKNEFAKVQ